MRETSGEARAEAPTAKDPDSMKDLPIISTVQNINQPESCDEALPPACCTPATRTPGPAAMFSSDSVEWYTPPKIIEAVRELFGGTIDLDPCSNAKGAAANVPARVHYTQEDNGLFQPWFGNVYMNPPYGAREIVPWIERVRMEYESRRVTAAVVLVKAATSARWFRTLSPKYIRCEVAGRLKFSGHPDSAPFSSVLFYLGDDVQRFADVFGRHGVIVGPWAAVRKTEEVSA